MGWLDSGGGADETDFPELGHDDESTSRTENARRERVLIDAILAELPMTKDGTGHVAGCGYDETATPTCGCYSLPERLAWVIAQAKAEAWKAGFREGRSGVGTLADNPHVDPLDDLRARFRPAAPMWRSDNHQDEDRA